MSTHLATRSYFEDFHKYSCLSYVSSDCRLSRFPSHTIAVEKAHHSEVDFATKIPTVTSSNIPAPAGTCGNLYDRPVRDAVCAMPYNQDSKTYMVSCCKDADITSYYDDYGL